MLGLGAVMLGLAVLATRPAPAPEAVFVTLQGERIGVEALRGRVVVVSFWATDCPICIKEMPDLARSYERFRGRGLELIAVAMRHDPPNYVVRYAERNRLPFKVALDPLGEHARAFGDVRLTPTTFVIDRRGRIAARITGALDFAALDALIEKKLKESIQAQKRGDAEEANGQRNAAFIGPEFPALIGVDLRSSAASGSLFSAPWRLCGKNPPGFR